MRHHFSYEKRPFGAVFGDQMATKLSLSDIDCGVAQMSHERIGLRPDWNAQPHNSASFGVHLDPMRPIV